MITLIVSIVLILFALFLSFIFSGAETALASLDYNGTIAEDFENYTDKKLAKVLKIWKSKPWRILNAIIIGNNIMTIVISIIGINLARETAKSFAISETLMAFWFAVFSIGLVLIFGEIIPKVLAREYPEKFFTKTINIILFFDKIIYPINVLFSKQMTWISEVFGFNIMEKSEIKEDEVLEVLDIGEAEGSIDESEKEVIESIISFEDLTADSIMMPKTKMDYINVKDNISDILKKVKKWKYSRIPVYDNDFDNIIGLLYTKDLLVLK